MKSVEMYIRFLHARNQILRSEGLSELIVGLECVNYIMRHGAQALVERFDFELTPQWRSEKGGGAAAPEAGLGGVKMVFF